MRDFKNTPHVYAGANEFVYCFWCYSNMADYEFMVEVERSADLPRAIDVAEQALEYYGDPDESPAPDYYYNAGYCEVVRDALNKAGINHTIYAKLEED